MVRSRRRFIIRPTFRISSDPKEWIAMAEQWEWVADTANGSWLLPSKNCNDGIERWPELKQT